MNVRFENCNDIDREDLGWCATNGELIPNGSPGSFGFCDGKCHKYKSLFEFEKENNEFLSDCCQEPDLKTCKAVTVHNDVLKKEQDIDILGKILTFDHTIPPNGLVYSDSNGNQAIVRLY